MKLRYDTKHNPLMTGILIIVCIPALFFILVQADFTTMIFGTIGKPEPPARTMTQEQYAEALAFWRQQNAQKQGTASDPVNQTAPPMQQVMEHAPTGQTGAVYQYTDDKGTLVMVDELDKVPKKYRAGMKTSSGMYGQQRTAVEVRNNQIWVPVTIGHKGRTVTTRLLLDTGATNTSISPALARRLGVQATETTGGAARLADGSMVRTAHMVVDHVTVGPKVKRDVNVQIMPRAGDEETGLLGMNFLGEFPHIVEARAGVIRWQ